MKYIKFNYKKDYKITIPQPFLANWSYHFYHLKYKYGRHFGWWYWHCTLTRQEICPKTGEDINIINKNLKEHSRTLPLKEHLPLIVTLKEHWPLIVTLKAMYYQYPWFFLLFGISLQYWLVNRTCPFFNVRSLNIYCDRF